MNKILEIKEIEKTYKLDKADIPVLKGINMSINKGEWIALLGASGSGKTTLMNIIGTLEKSEKGSIIYEDTPLSTFSNRKLTKFRNEKIGFIFQSYQLFPELTVLENVTLPAMLKGSKKQDANKKAIELIEQVGLSHRIKHKPTELSGGEQQRAAIARSLINSPKILLADEPTGNLDSKTGKDILDIFIKLHENKQVDVIIMVTHDVKIAQLADRIVMLEDGIVKV